MRRDPDDCDGHAVDIQRSAKYSGVSSEFSLPIVFADQNRGSRRTLLQRIKGSALNRCNSENLEVIVRDEEHVRLRFARTRRLYLRQTKRDESAKRVQGIPIRFVIGIAESEIGDTGVPS